jgi:hypothetical protein
MKTNTIGPHDQLPNKTRVRVGMRLGVVVDSKIVSAIPSGLIVVHTIELTHRIVRWPARRFIELNRPIRMEVNYSGISVIQD